MNIPTSSEAARNAVIANHNDAFRAGLADSIDGLQQHVRDYAFNFNDDAPERDCGNFDYQGQWMYWFISYEIAIGDVDAGVFPCVASPELLQDPALATTPRILTILNQSGPS